MLIAYFFFYRMGNRLQKAKCGLPVFKINFLAFFFYTGFYIPYM